jgi:hypothetical protein
MNRGSKSQRAPKTDGTTGAAASTQRGGTPLAVASPVRRRPACETPFVLLIQGIAYRLQEKTLGGLKLATVRLLERIADDAAARRESSPPPANIRVSAGTVLIREWHDKKHQVTVAGRTGFSIAQSASIPLADSTNDDRQPLVRAAALRPQVRPKGADQ